VATKSGIFRCFRLWETAGCKRPAEWQPPAMVEGVPDLDGWEVLQTWDMLLADVADADLARGAIRLARTKAPWWPTVPDVLAAARADVPQLDARDAWGEVWARLDSYSTPEKKLAGVVSGDALSATLSAIAAVGGWKALCATTIADQGYAREAFVRAYDGAMKRLQHVAETAVADRMLAARREASAVEGPSEAQRAWLARMRGSIGGGGE